jgi:predicted ATP-dependent endonuclease of OLD family
MKKALIITEGKHDAEVLQKILPQEILEKIQIVPSGGSALSLARTVLVTKQIPTVLLVDADSNDERTILGKQSDLNESLSSVSIGTKFKVFLIIPEMEVLFLENPKFVKNVSRNHKEFSPFELQLAKSNPKKFLSEIIENTDSKELYQKLFKDLDEETLLAMKNHKIIKDLTEFLSSVLDDAQISSLALEK